jgi:hypothetical protein
MSRRGNMLSSSPRSTRSGFQGLEEILTIDEGPSIRQELSALQLTLLPEEREA